MAIGIVATQFGKVSGMEVTEGKYAGITRFKGVRYGGDTGGANRWKPPMDPTPWEGVIRCDGTGVYKAMQPDLGALQDEPYRSDFYFAPDPPSGEDCLFLDITTGAQQPGEKRPVFLWFHGGGLGGGNAFEAEFDGMELARKGIVVVSVAQRLNVFGYLALPQLSAEQGGVSGNYGLMDEVKALDWVCENIAGFGGDPENITVGGQSGGTSKSGALAGSPMQKGRVKRVINQSDLHWLGGRYNTMQQAEELGKKFLISKGINPDISAEELRKLPAEVFYGTNLSPLDMAIGAMTVDGKYIKHQRASENLDEFASDCDYLSGGNYGESSMRAGFSLGSSSPVSEEEYYALAKQQLGDLYEKYDFEKNFPLDGKDPDKLSRYYASLGLKSRGGTIANRYFGAYRKEHGMTGKTYTYLFSRVAPCHLEEKGTKRDSDTLLAWHSSELWYTFGALRRSEDGKSNVPAIRPWTEWDEQLADSMSTYWSNFMKTGNPNGEGLPVWPQSDENYGWIELGDEITPHVGKDSVLDQMLFEHLMRNPDLTR